MEAAVAAATVAPTAPTPRAATARQRKIVGDISGDRGRRGRGGGETDQGQKTTRDGGARGKMRVEEKDTIQEVHQKKGCPERR